MDKKFYISSNKYSLQERQTKNYGKVYDVVFRIVTLDGEEKQKRLSGYKNKTLAKQAYLDFVTENCELVKNNPIKRQKRQEKGKEKVTVSDLSATYLLSLKNQNKESTLYEKEKVFKSIFIPRFGNYELKQLTKQELYCWQDELWAMKNPRTNEFYSYKYLSKLREFFSAFLTWCADRNEGFVNYLLQIKKPKRRTPKTEMQFWTRQEFDKFIKVVDNPTYKTLFTMLFFTGRRKGEVLALSPSDITDKGIRFNKSITRKTMDDSTYKVTSTKTEKMGITPICEPLKEELKKYTVPHGEFFFGGNRPIADNSLTRLFDLYCKKAEVKRIRIHDLRHSYVSMLIHLNAPLPLVADLIGDTLQQVTQTYAHLYDTDRQEILAKIK